MTLDRLTAAIESATVAEATWPCEGHGASGHLSDRGRAAASAVDHGQGRPLAFTQPELFR